MFESVGFRRSDDGKYRLSLSIRGVSKPVFKSAADFVLLNHKAPAFLNRKALPATHISHLKIYDLCH